MQKSLAERIRDQERKLENSKNRLSRLKGKAANEARKLDTRRKIIVGSAVLAHAEIDPAFATELRSILAKAVTRDQDKTVIPDLLTINGTDKTKSAPIPKDAITVSDEATA